jgi:hypothetical protein
MLQKWEQAPKCGSNEEEKKITNLDPYCAIYLHRHYLIL